MRCIDINTLNKIRKVANIYMYDSKKVDEIISKIKSYESAEYIVIYNPKWIGPSNSVKELFGNLVEIEEIFNEKEIVQIAEYISKSSIKQVVFNAMTMGYNVLAEMVKEKNKEITIKFLWHGGLSCLVNGEELYMFEQLLKLSKGNIIGKVGFMKQGMAEIFCKKGIDSCFVANTVRIQKCVKKEYNVENNEIKIGVYASGDRWEKNTYNQVSAASLVPNSVIDCIPITERLKDFCTTMNIRYTGEETGVPHDRLMERLSNNIVNLYVTFTEAGPMLPLESLEVGVPCIVGDNNHYFNNTELEKYLVVHSEDDINEIAEKINLCIENREKIMELYKAWKVIYDEISVESVENFLKM